jgi:hypothetical protein
MSEVDSRTLRQIRCTEANAGGRQRAESDLIAGGGMVFSDDVDAD